MDKATAQQHIQKIITEFDGELDELRAEVLRLLQQQQSAQDADSIEAVRKKIQAK